MKFELTPALKAYAIKHYGLVETSTEDEFKKKIGENLIAGKLNPMVLRGLVAPTPPPANPPVNPPPARQPAPRPQYRVPPAPTRAAPPLVRPAAPVGPTPEQVAAAINEAVTKSVAEALKAAGVSTVAKGVTPEAIFSNCSATQVRVKSAAADYEDTHKSAVYPERTGFTGGGTKHLLAGRRAMHGAIELDHPSKLDKAVAAAYFKWTIKCSSGGAHELPQGMRMTDHDTDLLNWSMRNKEWSGLLKGKDAEDGAMKVNRRKLQNFEIKALLDDSVSGGIEAAPIAFDDAIILIPILYGELFPLVNVENVARGRRMKGASMLNPTFTSGVAEGTAITPFNTAGFLSAFDTPIFPAVAAMELGLDFEEDSPVDAGSRVIEQYGLQALNYLDRVIAVGDGVTEPQGIFNASGANVVNSDAGAGGPLAVSDFEGLMFGMAKQFRTEAGAVPVYVANDTMYRRARSIQVGPGDERRVFGLTEGSYTMMDVPFKVENDIPNGKMAFVNLRRYRMYRRLGLNVRIETAGRTLALNNTKLIVLRMRYGGQIELGGALSLGTDFQF